MPRQPTERLIAAREALSRLIARYMPITGRSHSTVESIARVCSELEDAVREDERDALAAYRATMLADGKGIQAANIVSAGMRVAVTPFEDTMHVGQRLTGELAGNVIIAKNKSK